MTTAPYATLSKNEECNINSLPIEALTYASFFLSLDQVVKLSRICQAWKKEIQNLINTRIVHTTALSYKDLVIFRYMCPESKSDLQGFLKKFQNVRTLILGDTMIPYLQLCAIGKALPQIKTIDASGQKNLEASLFANLLNHCSELETLSLAKCPEVNSTYVEWAISKCPFIKEIDLSETSISDHTLEKLAKNCKYLVRINISECKSITDLGLAHLKNKKIIVEMKGQAISFEK